MIENLSFDRILSFVISIAIILAVIHYIVIPLGRGIGNDISASDECADAPCSTELGTG